MRRLIARFLVVVFLANLLGIATVESASDEHEVGVAHSHHTQDTGGKDASPCAHACHIGFHFMGLPVVGFAVMEIPGRSQVATRVAPLRSTSLSAPFHPPRSLA